MVLAIKDFCTLNNEDSDILDRVEKYIDSKLRPVETWTPDGIEIYMGTVEKALGLKSQLNCKFYLWIKYIYEKAGWGVDIVPVSMSGGPGSIWFRPLPF